VQICRTNKPPKKRSCVNAKFCRGVFIKVDAKLFEYNYAIIKTFINRSDECVTKR